MKFMVMMHAPRGNGDWQIFDWPAEAMKAHMKVMRELTEDLMSAGEYVGGEALAPPKRARVVRSTDGRTPDATDGPFAESKEFLAGYWIVDVESEDRALAIAARISAAPGQDGKPLGMAVEVRPVMSAPSKS